MISRETRASGLLRQLSRAWPMTTAGLVSETHMQLGSHPQEFCQSIAQPNLDHSQSHWVLKNWYTIYFFINFTQYHLNRRKIIQWNVYWKYFDKILLTYRRQPINERHQITWHPCDTPVCPTFLSEFSKLRHFEICWNSWSFMNWQMYMRSIYWQAMPKLKKSDK